MRAVNNAARNPRIYRPSKAAARVVNGPSNLVSGIKAAIRSA